MVIIYGIISPVQTNKSEFIEELTGINYIDLGEH